MNDSHPYRSRPAVASYNPGDIIFVTVCTRGRQPLLAQAESHRALVQAWTKAAAWRMGRYVIMPDHIHFFCSMQEHTIGLDGWMRHWKTSVARQCHWKHAWLPKHWDTRMRNARQYEEKWQYVLENPVRHGLVREPQDWPYQGEVHELMYV